MAVFRPLQWMKGLYHVIAVSNGRVAPVTGYKSLCPKISVYNVLPLKRRIMENTKLSMLSQMKCTVYPLTRSSPVHVPNYTTIDDAENTCLHQLVTKKFKKSL